MAERDDLDRLRGATAPEPDPQARRQALAAALAAYDAAPAGENRRAAQGSPAGRRLTSRAAQLWRMTMHRKLTAAPAIAGLLALPVAGYVAWQLAEGGPVALDRGAPPAETAGGRPAERQREAPAKLAPAARETAEVAGATEAERAVADRAVDTLLAPRDAAPAAAPQASGRAQSRLLRAPGTVGASRPVPPPAPSDAVAGQENRERFAGFADNPVRSALEDPVSTFSIDVDTASYAFVRRVLNQGVMPERDHVRVEEMINYFSYDWPGPASPDTPFNATVTVTPNPWNADTRLMHVGIKGYDIAPADKPAANLVFLIDTSGSMNATDKLPLLKAAFRLMVERLAPSDTVSIVTYAGNAGTVLEPTPVADKARILDALDRLEAGGRTAGAAGIREAYRLARQSFVESGVNRVMLATDGDFNIGAASDAELERLIEAEREAGVYLSVFGFGRGNLNDSLMQTLAQNGNGTAAYIDTLAEAEKVLVEEASATLFPIAGDVKIQVEFNPARIAEYRLIGYESRALSRADFNDDRVDAGDIGAGHTVTAIYEITPADSAARLYDDLRYGAPADADPAAGDELAFLRLRYKLPGEDVSRLIERPVGEADAVAPLAAASDDVRFSIAVAAFGQKLRGSDRTAGLGYDRILEIASAARGSDPYGYRAEFLSLVRLASALERGGR